MGLNAPPHVDLRTIFRGEHDLSPLLHEDNEVRIIVVFQRTQSSNWQNEVFIVSIMGVFLPCLLPFFNINF